MTNLPTVAVYITAYEDPTALEQCLLAISAQTYPVKKVFIVDNSRKKSIPDIGSLQIVAEHYPENIGISGGLEVCLQWAIEEGYDLLWTFDQDSQPNPDCLEKLIDEYAELNNRSISVGLIAPLALDSNTGTELHGSIFDRYRFKFSSVSQEPTYECDVVITSGSLVSMEAARQAERPDPGLFIDAVDWDYCLKLKKVGYRIFVTRRATMKHRFSDLSLVKLPLGIRNILINNYSPLRVYYISRNHTYIATRTAYRFYVLHAVMYRVIRSILLSLKILLFEPSQKSSKIWLCFLGTFDGLLGRLGKLEIQ